MATTIEVDSTELSISKVVPFSRTKPSNVRSSMEERLRALEKVRDQAKQEVTNSPAGRGVLTSVTKETMNEIYHILQPNKDIALNQLEVGIAELERQIDDCQERIRWLERYDQWSRSWAEKDRDRR